MNASTGTSPEKDFHEEVASRFGMLPNFFCSAPAAAGLIEELWAFAKSAYMDSPLPSLFKERLFVQLSRFCEVRYCIVRHVGFLIGEGHPAGDPAAPVETVAQALALLRRPAPEKGALDRAYERLLAREPSGTMPEPEMPAEGDLLDALTVIFLTPSQSERARTAVRHAVGDRDFELLAAFLAFVRTAHYWTETHPDLAYEPDIQACMERHPELARLLLDAGEAEAVNVDAVRRRLAATETALHDRDGWLAAQKEAFQAAMNGTPLAVSLGILADAVVGQAADGRRCAFYIADADGKGLRHVVGMPESYAEAVDGFAISLESLACGLAVASGQPVITPDIREEPRWRDWTPLASDYGYRGCWSFPVETATGELVGSLALYFAKPRDAEPHDFENAAAVTQAAAIIISRHQQNEERARAERALRESEEKYAALFAASPAPFLVIKPDAPRFTITEVNDAYLAATMRTREEVVGRGIFEAFPDNPDDAAIAGVSTLRASIERVLASRQPDSLPGLKYDIARPDGTFEDRWWSPVNSPVLDENGEVEAIIHNANDVTEEHSAVAALRESETRLRTLNADLERQIIQRSHDRGQLWQVSPDMLSVIDLETGRFDAVNPAWTATLGWSRDEIEGQIYTRWVHPDDAAESAAAFERAWAGIPVHRFENRYRTRGGDWRWLSWVALPDGRKLYSTSRDVTAEKEREAELETAREALRQSQKVEAMGQLTGGVAHDFNNLLTPIVGSLDMLQRNGVGGEREQRLIAGAMQSADRAKTLVQRLLAFARRQPLQPSAVDVGRLVQGMADLLASTTGPQVRVVVEVADDLPPAKADPNQLEMALLNLGVNARDAMPDGGMLRISATRESVGLARGDLSPGPYVRLSVADTGVGMDEATLARAVEPFFSTKGVGKGTGLGLSMAHGLAAQLGGVLKIHSRPGVGTNVEFWLPLSQAAIGDPNLPAALVLPGGARGLVLLVDDEDVVRASTADMLEELGYRVREANSGAAALALIGEGLAPDIVITDHLMPSMNGVDLARAVRARFPELPILIVSGYAEAEGVAPDLPRLTKPFRSLELAASLASFAAGDGQASAAETPV